MSEELAGDKKRMKPVGLGQKKAKVDDEDQKGLFFELPEDASQLDELRAMLDAAEACLDDTEKSTPLLRGVIHECDLILKSKGDDETTIDSEFYTLYGDALFLLGQIEFREDAPQVIEFVKEALERYERALDFDRANKSLLCKKIIAAQSQLYALDEECASLTALSGIVESTCKDLDKQDNVEVIMSIEEAAHEADFEKMGSLARLALDNLSPDNEPMVEALRARLVNLVVEAQLESIVEEDGDDKDLRECDKLLIDSIDRLTYFKDDLDIIILLGEALLLRGSVLELSQDDEAAGVYLEAKELFEKAKSAGKELPEGVRSFLDESQ